MTSTLANTHPAECMCPNCLMADMDAFVSAQGGKVYANEKTAPEKMRNKPAGQRSGRGYVRTISVAQQNLIKRLIVERDITNLTLLPGQTINIAEIPTMGVKGGSALIEKLFACPMKPNNSVRMATEGQLRFIRSLNEQAGNVISEGDIKTIEFAEVQEVLDSLKTVIANNRKAPVISTVTNNEITVGGYIQKSTNRVFNVYKAKQGTHLLVKEYKGTKWEYVGGIARLPRDVVEMNLAESAKFGQITGSCCQCGRTLTKKSSIEAGIGPICAEKFA